MKEVPPAQHRPAFQNSLLGNLETDLKGKNYSGPRTPTMRTCAQREGISQVTVQSAGAKCSNLFFVLVRVRNQYIMP